MSNHRDRVGHRVHVNKYAKTAPLDDGATEPAEKPGLEAEAPTATQTGHETDYRAFCRECIELSAATNPIGQYGYWRELFQNVLTLALDSPIIESAFHRSANFAEDFPGLLKKEIRQVAQDQSYTTHGGKDAYSFLLNKRNNEALHDSHATGITVFATACVDTILPNYQPGHAPDWVSVVGKNTPAPARVGGSNPEFTKGFAQAVDAANPLDYDDDQKTKFMGDLKTALKAHPVKIALRRSDVTPDEFADALAGTMVRIKDPTAHATLKSFAREYFSAHRQELSSQITI